MHLYDLFDPGMLQEGKDAKLINERAQRQLSGRWPGSCRRTGR